jgi:60 kDa SS-A/Ro ribonucleoprotein
VIDNGRMLRNFVQIMRSGAVGRTSLGTRPSGSSSSGWSARR